jgi:hypothetical protein
MLSIGLWWWYIDITITILDIIHRPVFYLKHDVSEMEFVSVFRWMNLLGVPKNGDSLCLRTAAIVKVTLQPTVSQSVCLDAEPFFDLMTRCLLLLTITVVSLWRSLSDERSDLSPPQLQHSVRFMPSVCHCSYQRILSILYAEKCA